MRRMRKKSEKTKRAGAVGLLALFLLLAAMETETYGAGKELDLEYIRICEENREQRGACYGPETGGGKLRTFENGGACAMRKHTGG